MAQTPWFDTAWTNRIPLTVNPAQVSGTTNDYVAYVDLSILPADFFTQAKADGSDIVVTASDMTTKLSRELVSFDAGAEAGELHVKVPTLASTTEIYVYFNNPTATEVNTAAVVWQDYRGVWHLDEDSNVQAFGTVLTTLQAMDGGDGGWAVLYGASPADTSIDVAIDEDQIGDAERNHTLEQVAYLGISSVGTSDIVNSGNTIVGEIGKATSVGAASTTISLNNTYTNPVVITTYNLPSASDNPAVPRVTSVGSDSFDLYIQNPSGNAVTTGDVYYIVMEAGLHTLAGGLQMEAGTKTITGTNRSGNWNNNQMQQVATVGVFTTPAVFGQVMTTNDPDWQAFWTSNGTQTNPPTDASMYVGRHVAGDSDTTRAAETVGYLVVESGTATTDGADFIAGVSADAIGGVDDAAPYSFPFAGGAAGVVSNVFEDSTVNSSNAGLAGGVTTERPGKLGFGIELDGVNGSHLPIDNLSYGSANSLNELTASFWINTTQTGRSGILDFDRSDHWEVGLNFHNAGGQAGTISFDTAASTGGIRDMNSTATINDGSWHQVTVVYDDAALNDKSIYIDGVLDSAVSQHTTGLGTNNNRFGFLGNGSEASSYNGSNNGLPQAGLFDEVRITHTAQTAAEIQSAYNNQNAPLTFFTVGPIEKQNQAPSKPTVLFADHTSAQTSSVNPADLALVTPARFSALFQDPDMGDEAVSAQIQVSTDATFATVTHWDSASSTIATTTESVRTGDIEYDNFGTAATMALAMDDGATSYYWRMRTYDVGGLVSPWSDPATFSLLDIPNAPSAISVLKEASDDFTVMWADNSTNETQFIVERREDSGGGFGAWTQIATTTANVTEYDDLGVTLNSAFQYRVFAYNFAGMSAVVADNSTHFSDPAAPIAVFGDYQNDTEFEVNWTDQSLVVLTDSVEHCIGQVACDAEIFTQIGGGVITSTSSPFSDVTGIGVDEIYRWRVRADNGTANSTYTLSPFEYTSPGAPGVPTAAYVSDAIINVTWTDNSVYEDGFRVYVSEDGGVFTEVTPGTNTVGQNSTSYTFTDGAAGSTYQFEVHTHVPDTVYNTDLTSVATTTTVQTTPVAPDNVVGTFVADNDITVSWDDNSDNENQFKVLVSENTGAFTQFATTTADTTSVSYTGGSEDNSYVFQVRAVVNANAPTNPIQLDAISNDSDIVYTTPNTPTLASSSVSSLGVEWVITDTATFETGFELNQSDGTTLVKDIPLSNITSVSEGGLSPNTQISRTARTYVENSGVKLYSDPSATQTLYTLANTPFIATTTIMDTSTTSIDWVWQTESNPSNTEYFATNITTTDTFGWSTTASWNQTGLACENSYDFEVKARNQDLIETVSATSTQSTPTCSPTITLPTTAQVVSSSTVITGTCSSGATVTITSPDLTVDPTTFTCVGGVYAETLNFTASSTGAASLDLSQTKAPFATSTIISVGVVVDPSTGADSDADGVSDALEDAGHNGGDGNGDGIADSLQPSVAGVPNIVTGGYTTIESVGACSIVQDAGVSAESTLATQDSAYEYPVGLADYKLQCPTAGATSTVSIYYDQVYDTSAWVLRKYASSTNSYNTVSDLVTVVPTEETIGSHMLLNGPASSTAVSKISFVIQDGDVLDDDIIANMTIVDPVGPATLIVTTTSSSGGGGTRYYCRDSSASNYTTRKGKEDNGLCKYEAIPTTVDTVGDTAQDLLNEIAGTNTAHAAGSCSPLLSTNMSRNITTNTNDVKDLQNFLNNTQGEDLKVDGTYDEEDYEAVKRFQNKYKSSVLDIWGLGTATGYVGRTTRLKINALHCAATTELTCPAFTQYHSRNNPNHGEEVGRLQTLLTDLDFYAGAINSQYDTQTISAVTDFQETFSATMLKPWGLTKGTGYKYKTTNKFLNELYGCNTEDIVLENGQTVSY